MLFGLVVCIPTWKVGTKKEVEEMVRQLYAIKSGAKDIKIDREKLKRMVAWYKQ